MQILVKAEDYASDDKYDLIYGVIDYVNALFEALYKPEEIPVEAFYSYYADYYLQQTLNGGISQFVYNSRWSPQAIEYVVNGLKAMKAEQNLALFSKIAIFVSKLEKEDLTEYISGDYFDGRTDIRDSLDEFNDEFFALQKTEDLIELNHEYIRGLANLSVLDSRNYQNELRKLQESVPDKENRRRQAEENEPEHIKIIKSLCEKAGQELLSLNAGDYGEYNGEKVFEMHISASKGHHYVVILENSALLFDGTTRNLVDEITF